jgi:hypothetical protein
MRSCATPLDEASLLAYWLGELDEAEDARIGEHLLGCGPCTASAQWLADAASGVRSLVDAGAVQAVVTDPFLKRAAAGGLRLREYRVQPEGSVNCTLGPDDDLLVTRLVAPLTGESRVDLVVLGPAGETWQRSDDVPFDAASGEVLTLSRVADVRAMPAVSFRMRLLASDPKGERVLGTYGFNHAPWPGHPKA